MNIVELAISYTLRVLGNIAPYLLGFTVLMMIAYSAFCCEDEIDYSVDECILSCK